MATEGCVLLPTVSLNSLTLHLRISVKRPCTQSLHPLFPYAGNSHNIMRPRLLISVTAVRARKVRPSINFNLLASVFLDAFIIVFFPKAETPPCLIQCTHLDLQHCASCHRVLFPGAGLQMLHPHPVSILSDADNTRMLLNRLASSSLHTQ